MKFQGGDTVARVGQPNGFRGMVLGYWNGAVMVSWEQGFDEWVYEDEETLELVEVLDLMVEAFEGKETKWRYGYTQCGRVTREVKR